MKICSNLDWKYNTLLIAHGTMIGNGWFYFIVFEVGKIVERGHPNSK